METFLIILSVLVGLPILLWLIFHDKEPNKTDPKNDDNIGLSFTVRFLVNQK